MPRLIARWFLAALYLLAAAAHIAVPATFLKIMPDWVPLPEFIVLATGIAEGLGAIALLQGRSMTLRKAGAVGLALYALCVWPANANHMMIDLALGDGGLGLAYHVPRMLAQPVLIWLALWSGGVIDWPRRKRAAD